MNDGGRSPVDAAIDRAFLLLVPALAGFAGLTALAMRPAVVVLIGPWWPLLAGASAVAWITMTKWAPYDASRGRQVAALLGFLVLEALVTAPLVRSALDMWGVRVLVGAIVMTAAAFGGLSVYAFVKPTFYMTPRDAGVVAMILAAAIIPVSLGFRFPVGFVWTAPVVALTSVVVLDRISEVLAFTRKGGAVAATAQLCGCALVIFAELLVTLLKLLAQA